MFSKIEIQGGIWECERNKSSSPNDYNFSSIKNHWKTLKSDIITTMKGFHRSGSEPKGSNATFMNLIELKQYRPIFMLGCIYNKIISKLLANKMKKVLPNNR